DIKSKRADDDSYWTFELELKRFERPFVKNEMLDFFGAYKENCRYFIARVHGQEIGQLAMGYHEWNHRARIWDIYVDKGWRQGGIGTELVKFAIQKAKEWRCRSLVLETQSCNHKAISFYLRCGFSLVGFDLTAYTNEDVLKHEVRLEMGLRLPQEE
ncbi:MAG TPA: GNAT family N-acetyltransferase, partial [Candidatus Hodarchaeales archaeon]|nr:GNAT family N-acetyltransferase [Candidatus Hodarchaeales archaeon]